MIQDRLERWARRERIVVVALAIAATVGLAVALTVVRYLPTHDGPQHVLIAHIENDFSDPGSVYPEYYFPTRALVARGFSLLYSPLEAFLPWRKALQATLAIILLVWAWGAMAFTRSVDPRRQFLGLVGFATAFQWTLYMGFFSYLLSTSVGFFTLAIAFRSRVWWWRPRLAIASMLAVQAVFHIFAAEAVSLVLIILVLFRAPPRKWPRELGLLALMGMPTAYVAAYAAGWVGGFTAPMPQYLKSSSWLPWAEKFTMLAEGFTAGPWWRAWPPLLLAVAGLVFGIRRTIRRETTPEERALTVASLLFLITAVACPFSMPSWEFMSPRFTPMGVMLAIPLIPVELIRLPRMRIVAWTGTAAFVAASIAWAGWHNRDLERSCGPAFAALDAPITRRGPRMPIVLDSTCGVLANPPVYQLPYTEPAWNIGALYAVQQGGIMPYSFAGVPQLHSLVFNPNGRAKMPVVPERQRFWGLLILSDRVADAFIRDVVLTNLAAAGSKYEDIIFYGGEDDRKVIEARGWETDWSSKNLWIARYRGCPTRLQIGLSDPQIQPLVVEWGWVPEQEAFRKDILAANTAPPGSVINAVWEAAGCGKAWVRVSIEDASGTWKEGNGQCEGAGADGRLLYEASPKHNVESVRCTFKAP